MIDKDYCMTCQHPKTEAATCTHPHCECASGSNDLLSADFSLEKLIAGRKMRTHCRKYTTDELLDEIVALYDKYYLPGIKRLQVIASR